jgi:ribonuclease P protein component
MPALTVKKSSIGRQKKSIMVIVGAKVSKKATERNLLKRRIRAIMKPIIEREKKEYTVIAHPEATKLTFQELKTELEKHG